MQNMKREIFRSTTDKGGPITKLLISHDGGKCWVTRSQLSTGKTFYRVLWGAKKHGQTDDESQAYQVSSTVSLAAALRYKNEAMTILNLGGKLPLQSKQNGDVLIVDTSDMVDAEYYPDEETDEAWQRAYGYGMRYVNERKEARATAAMQKQLEGLDDDCPECMHIRFSIEDKENPHEDYTGLFYQVGTNGHFFGCPIGGG